MRRINFLLLLAAAVVVSTAAIAQPAYPSKPLKMIVPYPAGGPSDIMGRLISERLATLLGQPVFVENVAGANGNIGVGAAARAPADGYTLLMGSAGPLTINPSLYAKVPFNTIGDFSPVALVAEVPLVLVTGPSLNVKTVAELIALAKKRPGELTFASSGNGSTNHLAAELLKKMAGIDMRHIAYKGAALALPDLLAGRVDMMVDLTASALPHIATGRLQPIAVASMKRLPQLPNIPTLDESGLSGFEVTAWYGVLVPVGTSPEILAKLAEAVSSIAQNPTTQSALATQGARSMYGSSADFAQRLKSELPRWAKIVKDANVQVN